MRSLFSNQVNQRSLKIQGHADESIVVSGDRNTIEQGPNYYTTNVFSPISVEPAQIAPSQALSRQDYQWRKVLVDNIKHYWIEGVLEKSLHHQALIELGLEERSTAVASPLNGVEEFSSDIGSTFLAGTSATAIFDDLGAGRTLLILGEPGAGKTTTLLKLAQSQLERLDSDLSQPIPVILNLSSWPEKCQPIAEWLVQELYETFQVSKSLSATWIYEEQLVLHLDGLDEVATRCQNSCVKALNQFIQDHGRTEMVVCSRAKEYESLSERLRLRSAIYVRPLAPVQVDQYLEQAGEQLKALRTVLAQNAEVRAFASSPLILSVMSFVYQGCSQDDLPRLGNAENFRQQLFEAYVNRMFQRRDSTPYKYAHEQTKQWLIWMAQRMVRTSQTIFLIEKIQPSWLQSSAKKRQYRLESSLAIGLFVWLTSILANAIDQSWSLGSGVPRGLLAVAIALTLNEITPVETLKWSWQKARRSLYPGFCGGVLAGLFFGLIFSVGAVFSKELSDSFGLAELVGVELFLGLLGGLVGALFWGFFGALRGPGMKQSTQPNQGIWKSAQNALTVGLISGTVIGLGAGLIWGPISGVKSGLKFGSVIGLVAGGSAVIRHFSLRLRLYRMGVAPWNYTHFLNYATERLFLQKVGGGYIFVHRMLLEHFAQMTLAPADRPTDREKLHPSTDKTEK